MVAAHKQDKQQNTLDTTSDTTLTPPGTQYGATPSRGNRLGMRDLQAPCKPLQRLMDHS